MVDLSAQQRLDGFDQRPAAREHSVDAVARLLPGVLGNETSAGAESFEHGVLEYPQYTRPPEFRGSKVPDVLLSGNHAEVDRWRRRMSPR